MALFKYIAGFFLSIRTAVWSLGILILLLLAGAFIMPVRQEFQSLHSVPLFAWLPQQSPSVSWWLWLSIGALAVLSMNTVVCSIDSLIKKRSSAQWLLLISPQVIHIGFLFILLAHLLSGVGSAQGVGVAREGTSFMLYEDNTVLLVKSIDIRTDPYGYVSDWEVGVEYTSDGKTVSDRIRPNSPSLYKGLNVNVKDLQAAPEKAVLLQISRDPGAVWALAGGMLFMVGILTLAALKIRADK